MEPKQVIVIRKDLKMRKGKMCAQAAHASMKVILDRLEYLTQDSEFITFSLPLRKNSSLHNWIEGLFTKIVLSCNSEEELLNLKREADKMNILNALIQDSGKTEFHGIPTYTALAIGPDEPEKIDKVTGRLKLL